MTDHSDSRRMIVYASLCGATGVILGSLGAHGLDTILTDRGYDAELIARRLDQFNTGVRYHLFHTLALLAVAAIPAASLPWGRWVGRLFIAGVLMFSGSLYLLVATNDTRFAMITPWGGFSWIVGWILLGITAWRQPAER